MNFIFSGIIFFLWAILIIWLYYTQNISHLGLIFPSNTISIIIYLLIIGACFSAYKYYKIQKNPLENSWNFFDMLFWFFLQIILVALLYTTENSSTFSFVNAFILIFHTFSLLIFPIFLVFLFRAIGASIFIKNTFWKNLSLKFRAIIETAIGLIIVTFILFLGAYFGIFHQNFLIATFIILTIASIFGFKQIFSEIQNIKISEKISPLSFKIISAELVFLALTFVMAVSFINTLRPFPIGWDDLGVYMNFPRLIASNESILNGAGMISWQLITAIGFAFDNATLAFFINQIGGILATITIIASLSLLLENKNSSTKQFLILPILLGAVYYVMPMTIFQQAKDMKLDPALMFVSITAVMSLIYGINYFFQENIQKKNYLLLFFIAGILTGFAFSIKLTSLILVISSIGFLAYRILGFGGFFGFIGIFIAIFTKWNLWSHMFVWMPENTTNIVLGAMIMAILGFSLAWKNFWKNFLHFFIIAGIFAWGILISLSPWFAKNFIESNEKSLSINTILNGNGENQKNGHFTTDYHKIYTKEEFDEKNKNHNYSMITSSGSSLNEDFARYFGKESGINNYIKLPVNLTLQKNQKWEFTDITYIFLAFVPVSLLFFTTRNEKNFQKIWTFGIFFFLILGFISIAATLTENIYIKNFLGTTNLPLGYGVLMTLVWSFLALAHFTLSQKTEHEKNILGMLFLLAFYGFLFWISAFWVVWYGILIYFLMLTIIGFGVKNFNEYSDDENSQKIFYKKIFSYGFFALMGIYLFGSALLHSMNNLLSASYNEYKFYTISEKSSIFSYKSDYFTSLLELNVQDKNIITQGISDEILKSDIKDNFIQEISPENYSNPLVLHKYFQKKIQILETNEYQKNYYKDLVENQKQAINKNISLSALEKSNYHQKLDAELWKIFTQIDAQTTTSKKEIAILDPIFSKMYEKILSPSEENKNTKGIYRIGTFFTYFVNDNRKRFFEDSLITNFQTYFYDENPQIIADRLQKMGMNYLLIDLNAATIDKNESHMSAQKEWRKSLTDRYENLLLSVRDQNFELIDTDNICLRLAIDEFHKGKLTDNREFLNIAGTNYYNFGLNISQEYKINNCAKYIFEIIKNSENDLYNYLLPLNKARNEEEFTQILTNMVGNRGYFALFSIKK